MGFCGISVRFSSSITLCTNPFGSLVGFRWGFRPSVYVVSCDTKRVWCGCGMVETVMLGCGKFITVIHGLLLKADLTSQVYCRRTRKRPTTLSDSSIPNSEFDGNAVSSCDHRERGEESLEWFSWRIRKLVKRALHFKQKDRKSPSFKEQ
eukprot:scaffold3513_cov102-Cylindrotheca_fusiformis.AAC.4